MKKKPKVLDARFKGRGPHEWVAIRVETTYHVEEGDEFVRPDVMAWICDGSMVLQRTVHPHTPESALAELLEEAVALRPDAPPTVIKVVEQSTADTLAKSLKRQVPVVVAPSVKQIISRTLVLDDDDLDVDRPMLHGGKVTPAAVGEAVAAMWTFHDATPWDAMLPWDVEIVMRAPSLGLEGASVKVHAAPHLVTFARTLADRDGTVEWTFGSRPQGTRWIDLDFSAIDEDDDTHDDDGSDDDDAPDDDVLAEEADSHGWRSTRWPLRVASLRAWDVDDFLRPLLPSDLALARVVVLALTEWFSRRGVADPKSQQPVEALRLTVEPGVEVELSLRAFGLASTEAESPEAWADAHLPAPYALPDSYAPYKDLIADLRDADKKPPSDLEARVLAAGSDAVPALLAELDDPANLEIITGPGEWFTSWTLLALGRIGDPRALPHVLRLAATRPDDLGDLLTEDLPSILAAFGPAAIDALTVMLTGVTLDTYARAAAAKALYLIGVDHPEARPTVSRIYAALFEAIDDDFDPDGELAITALDEAARMHDDAVDAAVFAAFENELIPEKIHGRDDYERERKEPAWERSSSPDHTTITEKLRDPWWRSLP